MSQQPSIATAQSLHQTGRLDEAKTIYSQLISEPATKADAHYGLGTVLLQQESFEKAVEQLRNAVLLEPRVAEFHFNLGLAYRSLNQLNQAESAFEQAASCAQDDAQMFEAACSALAGIGRDDLALSLLGTQSQIGLSGLQLMVKLELSRNNFGAALPLVQQIAHRYPQQASSHFDLAQVAARLRNFTLAISAYDQFLLLSNGGEVMHQLAKVDLLLQARKGQEALSLYQDLASAVPESAQFVLLAARCHLLQGDTDQAVKLLKHTLELDASNGHAWQSIVEICDDSLLSDLVEQAKALPAGTLESSENSVMINFALARAHHRLNHTDLAFDYYCDANKKQQIRLKRHGKAYDLNQTEKDFGRIQQLFQAVDYKDSISSSTGPIFVTGMPRSGTSLVEKILGGLEKTTMGGELEAMEFIASQFYWQIERGTQAPPQNVSAKEWSAMAERYAHHGDHIKERTHLIDKMPHNFRHLGLIAKILPSASLIYIERDPMDVCWSIFTKPFPDDHSYACDFDDLAHYFSQHQKIIAFWRQQLGDRLIHINYEALVNDPTIVMRGVAERCGLEWDDQCVEVTDRLSTAFTFSELQIRQPITNSAIAQWKQYEHHLQPLKNALKRNGVGSIT